VAALHRREVDAAEKDEAKQRDRKHGRQYRRCGQLCEAEDGKAQCGKTEVVLRPRPLVFGFGFEKRIQLLGVVAEIDRPTVAVEVDDVRVVHLRQVALVEADVDAFSLL